MYENQQLCAQRNLADVRKGQYEGLAEKMKNAELWTPDYAVSGTPHSALLPSGPGCRFVPIMQLGTER